MDHDHHHEVPAVVSHTALLGGSTPPEHIGINNGASHHHSMQSMHSMAFHFGSAETILFDFWQTLNGAGIVLSCVIIVVMCISMEFVRFIRAYRRKQKIPLIIENQLRMEPTISGYALIDALLHFIQITISYLLMLIFMTFNVWLCGAVLVGEVGSRLLFTILFPYMDQEPTTVCP